MEFINDLNNGLLGSLFPTQAGTGVSNSLFKRTIQSGKLSEERLYIDSDTPSINHSTKREPRSLGINISFDLAEKFGYESGLEQNEGDVTDDPVEFYDGTISFDDLCKLIIRAKGTDTLFNYENYMGVWDPWMHMQVDKALKIKSELGEDYEVKLKGRLNKRLATICSALIYNSVKIDVVNKKLELKKIIKYSFVPSNNTELKNNAIEIICDKIQDFEMLSEFIESYSWRNITDQFLSAFAGAGDNESLKFLLENAPHYVLRKLGDEKLWGYLLDMLAYDESSGSKDTSDAVFNMFSCGFSNAKVVYDKLVSSPDLVIRIYENMDNGNTIPFCQLVTALSLMFGPDDQLANVKRLYTGDPYLIINSNDDDTRHIYFKNAVNPFMHTWDVERKLKKLGTSAIEPVLIQLSPMEIIELYDASTKAPVYMCAIAVKKYIADKNSIDWFSFAMNVLTIISFISSVGILIRGAVLLVRIAAITDIVTTGISQLLKIPAIKNLLDDSEEGKWFLANWDTINMIANLGVMSPLIAEGIIKNGPKLLSTIKSSKQFLLAEGKKLADRIEYLLSRAKRVISTVDDIEDEVISLFRRTTDLVDNLGGRLLTLKEIKALRRYLWDNYGVKLKLVDKDYGLKQKLKSWNTRNVAGSFNPREGVMYLRSTTSELTVFHEMAHIKIWKKLSPEDYAKLPEWEDETYVWEQIWKTRKRWSKKELVDSFIYVNEKRSEYGANMIINEEMEELLRLNKYNLL